MKNTLLISAATLLFVSCGGNDPAKVKEMGDYSADVCACAMESTTTEEWTACNDKRKEFFTKFELDKDDAAGNKSNDIMYDCLTEYEK